MDLIIVDKGIQLEEMAILMQCCKNRPQSPK